MNFDEAKKLLVQAYNEDVLPEFLEALFEQSRVLMDETGFDETGKFFPKVAETLKRHGKKSKFKLHSWLLMSCSVFESAAREMKRWKVYRDETEEEHQERTRKEKVAELERELEMAKRA